MKFNFRKKLSIQEILQGIGRKNIDSTKIQMTIEGDNVEIDFGDIVLSDQEKQNLESFLAKFGYTKES